MVSNASEDLPDPLSPVITVKVLRGISTEMFFRLCWRAPRTVILLIAMDRGPYTGYEKSEHAQDLDGSYSEAQRGESTALLRILAAGMAWVKPVLDPGRQCEF